MPLITPKDNRRPWKPSQRLTFAVLVATLAATAVGAWAAVTALH